MPAGSHRSATWSGWPPYATVVGEAATARPASQARSSVSHSARDCPASPSDMGPTVTREDQERQGPEGPNGCSEGASPPAASPATVGDDGPDRTGAVWTKEA